MVQSCSLIQALCIHIYIVSPHLEHAAPALNPYLIKDVNSLESVQRFALKVCLKSGIHHITNCSTNLVCQISVPVRNTWVFVTYKLIVYNYILPLVPHSSQYVLQNTHSYVPFNSHTNCFYYSFFPHVMSLWNTLPSACYYFCTIHFCLYELHSL